MKKALILVDFENEWIYPDSEYFVGDISIQIEKTNHLIDFCRKNNYRIIWIRHVEKSSETEFVENNKSTAIIPSLNKRPEDVLITKYKIGSFYQTGLEERLGGVTEVVVCGILTNLCVRKFVEDAYDRDFKITVIQDCCVSFDQETHDFTIQDLKNTREEVKFCDVQNFIQG